MGTTAPDGNASELPLTSAPSCWCQGRHSMDILGLYQTAPRGQHHRGLMPGHPCSTPQEACRLGPGTEPPGLPAAWLRRGNVAAGRLLPPVGSGQVKGGRAPSASSTQNSTLALKSSAEGGLLFRAPEFSAQEGPEVSGCLGKARRRSPRLLPHGAHSPPVCPDVGCLLQGPQRGGLPPAGWPGPDPSPTSPRHVGEPGGCPWL